MLTNNLMPAVRNYAFYENSAYYRLFRKLHIKVIRYIKYLIQQSISFSVKNIFKHREFSVCRHICHFVYNIVTHFGMDHGLIMLLSMPVWGAYQTKIKQSSSNIFIAWFAPVTSLQWYIHGEIGPICFFAPWFLMEMTDHYLRAFGTQSSIHSANSQTPMQLFESLGKVCFAHHPRWLF